MACFFSNTQSIAADPNSWVNELYNLIECNGWDKCILKCRECKCVLWDENEEEYWYRTFDYNEKGHKSHCYASVSVNKQCKKYIRPI